MKSSRTHIMLCAGTGCVSNGSFKIKDALERELKKHNLQDEVGVVLTGCNGFCAQGPVAVVRPDGIFYQLLGQDDIPHLVEEHFLKGRPVKQLMYTPPTEEFPVPKMSDIGFFSKQRLIALRNRGMIDPEQIDEYIARDGYAALAKALTKMTPEQIIEEIKSSGLRGRGGAGFPTGRKWELARAAKGDTKHIVCNADEGDPGAFMDRSIIESDPHSVLEGMIIGAYAIGASRGHIYIRNEYPLARERLIKAIDQAGDYGLLGKDIFGAGFDLDISIHRGAGAFVCGEETSLIASLEGRSPEPTVRPPFPVESGVWKEPTNINNVETWANVPEIIDRGAEWFSGIGTETSKGTKVFSVVGKVRNTGLVEVPMGITLREIVYDIGGGIPNDKKFKAVQTGGPSGGCIPTSLLDLPIDYEKLAEVGSIMGSGGLIVLDEDTCMVDVARYFLEFLRDESCGKCTACREGVDVMYKILTKICAGDGEEDDIAMLEELSEAVKDAALCALGGTAPNPVLSTIRYFRDEYEAHIKYKRCPAGVCRGIISSACQHTCPLEQDVPCYIGLIAHGKFEQAIEIVRRENPLPSVCGRVCTASCEAKCRAGEGDGEGISIRVLKRFLADYERQKGLDLIPRPKQTRTEQVAVVGSGPAGLTCAYYLALEGYRVTVFESLPVAGGMLAVGIPDYRLPRDVLNWEIENIKKLGVEIKTDTTIGKDIQLSELQQQYNAVFIAIGAHKGLKMNIPGEGLPQVIDAVDFLRSLNLGQEVEIGQKVAVIGGGDAAIDAARVAKRLGKDVKILYRRTRREMPAAKEEIEEAIKEGIEIQYLTAPTRAFSDGARLTRIECIKMELGKLDRSGRRRPVPIEGSEFTLEIDTLLPAIGQQPDISVLSKGSDLKTSGRNTVEVSPDTLITEMEGVFAGGDLVSGPNAVTAAMAHGKTAAEMIHKYIQGQPLEREYKVTRPAVRVEPIELTDKEIEELEKPSVPLLAMEDRAGNFEEVELGLSEEMAIKEAKRCLRCDLELKEEVEAS
ncbi:MAG: NADH-quinone oxidoreductase subunit NuoF [Phycisphaerae bacterium]|nr:NADH-quinone oxidoreductase subunit NuoF [Phycisphaerae bacterium]